MKQGGEEKEATWSIYDVEWADQYDYYKLKIKVQR